jgi:acetylornithine deacetylase/succinyl-diaminopimelate desuccinylase-like protein
MARLARNFFALSGLLAVTLASTASPILAQNDVVTPSLIEKTAQANFREFFDLLSMPNDAIDAQDIRKNAEWLEAAFRKRGFATKQLSNNGKSLVFAEFARRSANAKTILFYMHFDGQPVIPGQWSQKSPWTAAVKRPTARGQWEDIAQEKLLGDEIDPNWRIFARSSSDDKGPIMMFLTAFDVLRAANAAPAINVKVLLDSEEEKGSPTIGVVAEANRELLAAMRS